MLKYIIIFLTICNFVFAQDPDINEFLKIDKDPTPINLNEIRKKMTYPAKAREMGISGKVTIRVLVDKLGAVEKVSVIRSPHKLLTDECLKYIYELKFTPASYNGENLKCWVNIPFDFKLDETPTAVKLAISLFEKGDYENSLKLYLNLVDNVKSMSNY